MLKKLLACALAGLSMQAASAAPSGWYDLTLRWRDGSFSGSILYDAASPYQVAQVNGTLRDTAQTTSITNVWNISNATPLSDVPLTFTNWPGQGDPLAYNAAFSLVINDLGTSLAVADPGMSWGLYDWSSPDFASQIGDSPLVAWNITLAAQDVPEPHAPALLGVGLFGMACMRRRGRTRPAA